MIAVYVSVVLGALSYAILDYIGRYGKQVFEKRYIALLLVNVLLGVVLVYIFNLKPDTHYYNGFDTARLLAFIFGAMGQKIVKLLFDIFDKKVRTEFGLNEKE